MRNRVLVLALAAGAAALAPAGCSDAPRKASSAAVYRCLSAVHAARDQGVIAPGQLVCADLYVHPRCAAAWRALEHPIGGYDAVFDQIETECRAACVAMSGGRPPHACVMRADPFGTGRSVGRVVAIDEAILRLEGVPAGSAADLAGRVAMMGVSVHRDGGGSALDLPGANQVLVIPDLPDADDSTGGDASVVVTITTTAVSIDGVVLDQTDLSPEIARSLHGAHQATLQVDQDVGYARVVQIMDALKAEGVTKILFAVQPHPAP